jgi:hypothetical protein
MIHRGLGYPSSTLPRTYTKKNEIKNQKAVEPKTDPTAAAAPPHPVSSLHSIPQLARSRSATPAAAGRESPFPTRPRVRVPHLPSPPRRNGPSPSISHCVFPFLPCNDPARRNHSFVHLHLPTSRWVLLLSKPRDRAAGSVCSVRRFSSAAFFCLVDVWIGK